MAANEKSPPHSVLDNAQQQEASRAPHARTEHLYIRMTVGEKGALSLAAHRARKSMSEFVRTAFLSPDG